MGGRIFGAAAASWLSSSLPCSSADQHLGSAALAVAACLVRSRWTHPLEVRKETGQFCYRATRIEMLDRVAGSGQNPLTLIRRLSARKVACPAPSTSSVSKVATQVSPVEVAQIAGVKRDCKSPHQLYPQCSLCATLQGRQASLQGPLSPCSASRCWCVLYALPQ